MHRIRPTQSDCPMVPAPHDDRIEVIPSIIEKEVESAVFCVLKRGPPPPALGTAQARRPMRVAPKAADEKMKGFCSFSGGKRRTRGTKAQYQRMTPVKSWWVMLALAGNLDGAFFHDGDMAPSMRLTAWPPQTAWIPNQKMEVKQDNVNGWSRVSR